jgi:hypothetical protein
MGIKTLYRHPRTTQPEPGHKVYPYLLCGIARKAVSGVCALRYRSSISAREQRPFRFACHSGDFR